MTNAEKYSKDIDKLADAIYHTDDFEEACNLKYDSQEKDYIGCRHEETEKGCMICIKDWLMKDEEPDKDILHKSIDQITTEMMEFFCDDLCHYPKTITSQEELDTICAECKMGQYVCDILNHIGQKEAEDGEHK